MTRVVLERPGVVEVDGDVNVRPSHPDEALVRLRLGGLCGSDLAAYRGTSPHVRYPRVLGHELLVDVLTCRSRPELCGKRAIVDPMIRCGRCRACRLGRYNACEYLQVMGVHVDGGFQDPWLVRADSLFTVPDTVPDNAAVLAEPLAVAFHAVQRGAPKAGSTCVVFGAGAIGLLISQLLVRARGCRAIVVDVNETRRRIARELGCAAVSGTGTALVDVVSEMTNGEMADVVFEATGNELCTAMTTAVASYAGRIVLVGWNRGPVEIDTVTLMRKEVDVLGSRNSRDAFPAVMRLLEDGVVNADAMITHRFAVTEAPEALRLLDVGVEQALKIVLAPDHEPGL